MLKRTLSTLGLWALITTLLVFFGTPACVWLVAIMSVATLHEFNHLMRKTGYTPFNKLGLILAAGMVLAPYYFPKFVGVDDCVAIAIIICCIRILGERNPLTRVETIASTIFGVVFVPFMLQFLVKVVTIDPARPVAGLIFGVWIIAAAKFCDVGALLTGLAFGKHRMAPVISPKKSWEGVAGGLASSILLGSLIAYFGRDHLPPFFTPVVGGLLALPLGVVGIVSDLIESVIKRRADIKDTGAIIPGIGGIFDLTDSLILSAPLGYIFLHTLYVLNTP